MTDPFPIKPSIDHSPSPQSVIDITNSDSSAIFKALGNETARSIIYELDAPTTASEIAVRIDTSIQNTAYHLRKLRKAGLVKQVGTWYSEKGREMTVYAPTIERVVIPFNEASDETPAVEASDTSQ